MKTFTLLSLFALVFARIPQRMLNEIRESEKYRGVDFSYGDFYGFGGLSVNEIRESEKYRGVDFHYGSFDGLDFSYGDFYGFGGLSVTDELPSNHSPFYSLCEPRRIK